MCFGMEARAIAATPGMRLSIFTETTKAKCPSCPEMGLACDIQQFGRCRKCTEDLVGPIDMIRDIVGPEPDEGEFQHRENKDTDDIMIADAQFDARERGE